MQQPIWIVSFLFTKQNTLVKSTTFYAQIYLPLFPVFAWGRLQSAQCKLSQSKGVKAERCKRRENESETRSQKCENESIISLKSSCLI